MHALVFTVKNIIRKIIGFGKREHKRFVISCVPNWSKGLSETLETHSPVRAGFIKIALESTWADCPHAALEGAAFAALKSNALMEIHTEKGALAEKACFYFIDLGLLPNQLVLCHMDKRPDSGLHKELARAGSIA